MDEIQLKIKIPEVPVKVDFNSDSIIRLQNSLLNGNYKFNVHQWRLFLGFLACLYENKYELRYYNLSIKELYSMTDLNHKDVLKLLRKDTTGLLKHVVEIKHEDGSISFYNLFYRAKYISNQGILQLAPHPELLEFYKELKNNFTDTYLKEVLKLSTSNTIKIYLILKQFDDTCWRKISFDDLRRQLGLNPGQYKRPIDLERRFVQKAQVELEKTDMAFTYMKYGTPVKGFHFKLKNKKKLTGFVPKTSEEKRAVDLLGEAGLAEDQVSTILSSISAEEVFKINYDMQIARANHQIKKTEAAWLINMFKLEHGIFLPDYRKPR